MHNSLGSGLDLEIPVLYEDNSVLVINKPAGITMHAKNNNDKSTTIYSIFQHKLAPGGELLRSGIVHRLDKDTSGLVIMAKTDEALEFLQKQFADRLVEKIYTALVWGHLKHPKAKIDLPIKRSLRAPNIMSIHAGGKLALSEYEVVGEYHNYSLVQIKLLTGRTHQIRVQFAHLGHAVVGDKLYGTHSIPNGLTRQFLHASKLSLVLPRKNKKQTFTAPLPIDLKSFLEQLE